MAKAKETAATPEIPDELRAMIEKHADVLRDPEVLKEVFGSLQKPAPSYGFDDDLKAIFNSVNDKENPAGKLAEGRTTRGLQTQLLAVGLQVLRRLNGIHSALTTAGDSKATSTS